MSEINNTSYLDIKITGHKIRIRLHKFRWKQSWKSVMENKFTIDSRCWFFSFTYQLIENVLNFEMLQYFIRML